MAGLSTFQSDVHLGDNDKLIFGDDDDLEIFHNSSNGNTIIQETTGGNLVIKGSNLFLQSASGEDFFKGDADGAIELYYDDTKKFETTGVGVTVFGTTQTQQLNVSGLSTFNDDVKVYSANLNVYNGYGQFGNVQIGGGNNRTIRTSTGNLILESNWNQVEILDDVIVSGIVTGNGFVGPLEGDVTGNLTGDVNVELSLQLMVTLLET